jgi:hypothetical protein
MPTPSRIRERGPDGYGPWMLGVVLVLALLSAARLVGGWNGDFEQWLALAVLIGSLFGAVGLLRGML